jgi:hypothetical protein
MPDQNPITRRLDLLHDQWSEFAQNPKTRLLRWLAAADEGAMVEAFVAQESEPEACETPDLFLRFEDGFENPAAHGYLLRDSFIRAYDEVRPFDAGAPEGARRPLGENGVDTSFVAPSADRSDDDIRALLRVLVAYHAHHEGQVAQLVAFLSPRVVADPAAYQLWLQRLMLQTPAQVRFIVVDSLERQQLGELAAAQPELVMSVPCDLNMSGTSEELLQGVGSDSPGDRFRQLFAAIGSAAKKGELAVVLPLAQSATQLATGMGCPHLAAVVQTLLAGTYSGAGDYLQAIRCYSQVELLADETYAHGQRNAPAPEGARELEGQVAMAYGLRLKRDARFGQGACLIAQRAWEHASKVFLDGAALSRDLQDARGELDALRLASLCFEQHGALQHAWQCGMKGLEVGAGMDAETRRTSSLPYLGESMLRLSRALEFSAYREPVERHLESLLEPGWRKSLEQGVS